MKREGQLWFQTPPLDGPITYNVYLSAYCEFWRDERETFAVDYHFCHFLREITISVAVPDDYLDEALARAVKEVISTAPGPFHRQTPPEGHCVWICSRWWPLARPPQLSDR